MSNFKRIAEERAKREEALYALDDMENDALYSRVCAECRIQKEPLDTAQKKKLGLSLTELAWKCPECGQVTEARGGIDEQTDGFSQMNNETVPGASIVEDGFGKIDKIEADNSGKTR